MEFEGEGDDSVCLIAAEGPALVGHVLAGQPGFIDREMSKSFCWRFLEYAKELISRVLLGGKLQGFTDANKNTQSG